MRPSIALGWVLACTVWLSCASPAQAAPPHGSRNSTVPSKTWGLTPQVRALAQELAQRYTLPLNWTEQHLAQAHRLDQVRQLILPPSTPSAKNWAAYRARFIEPRRIEAGVKFWREHEDALHRSGREAARGRHDERTGEAAERGGETPAEHEHRRCGDAEQAGRFGVGGDGSQGEADLRALQEGPQEQALDREHPDEDERVAAQAHAAEEPVAIGVRTGQGLGLHAEEQLRECVEREEQSDRHDDEYER